MRLSPPWWANARGGEVLDKAQSSSAARPGFAGESLCRSPSSRAALAAGPGSSQQSMLGCCCYADDGGDVDGAGTWASTARVSFCQAPGRTDRTEDVRRVASKPWQQQQQQPHLFRPQGAASRRARHASSIARRTDWPRDEEGRRGATDSHAAAGQGRGRQPPQAVRVRRGSRSSSVRMLLAA